jgi:hypothetical protein
MEIKSLKFIKVDIHNKLPFQILFSRTQRRVWYSPQEKHELQENPALFLHSNYLVLLSLLSIYHGLFIIIIVLNYFSEL